MQTDDYQATQDLYNAILEWFGFYLQFQPNDFYVTGECVSLSCLLSCKLVRAALHSRPCCEQCNCSMQQDLLCAMKAQQCPGPVRRLLR